MSRHSIGEEKAPISPSVGGFRALGAAVGRRATEREWLGTGGRCSPRWEELAAVSEAI